MSTRMTAIVAALGAVLTLAAFAPVATASREYVLKHPKREHCRLHYIKRVKTVRTKVHGRTVKRHRTVCVRRGRRRRPRFELSWLPVPPFRAVTSTTPVPPPVLPPQVCTTTFDGAGSNLWGTAANWTGGIPAGPASRACIPPGYANTVVFDGAAESPVEIGGLFAENPQGITLGSGQLTLANPVQHSVISNVKPGGAAVTL